MGSLFTEGHSSFGEHSEVCSKTSLSQLGHDIKELLPLTELPTLCTSRLHLKLAQVCKIVHGLRYFPDQIFEQIMAHNEHLSRHLTFYQPFAHSSAYFNSFTVSSVRIWNTLISKIQAHPWMLSKEACIRHSHN